MFSLGLCSSCPPAVGIYWRSLQCTSKKPRTLQPRNPWNPELLHLIILYYITLHYNTLLTWKPGSLEPANLRELLALGPWNSVISEHWTLKLSDLATLRLSNLGEPCTVLYLGTLEEPGKSRNLGTSWNTAVTSQDRVQPPGTIVTGPEPPGTSVGVGVTLRGETTANTCKHRVLNSNASTLFTLLAVFWFLFYGSRWMGNTASSHDNSLLLFAIFESWLNSFGCAFRIHKRPCHRRLIFGACLTRLLTFHL
jgi:hypothetical protein